MNFFCFSSTKNGQAVLFALFIAFLVFVVAAVGFSVLVVTRSKIAREAGEAERAFTVAESGLEDAILRVRNLMQLSPNYTLSVGTDGTADVSVVSSGSLRTITSLGTVGSVSRRVEAQVRISTEATVAFNYGVQVGDGGLEMGNNAIVDGSVFSNGNIIGGNGAEILGSAIVAGGINDAPSVEWAANDADQYFATVSGNRDIAQSFTATSSDIVSRVAVYLGKIGNPSASITLRLTEDNGDKPKNSSLADTTIDASTVGNTPSWINISFATPPSVTSGTKYWVVLDYQQSSGTDYWNWRKDASDGYLNHTGKYTGNWSSGSASWTNVGGDLAFRVWIGGVPTRIDTMIINDGQANSYINTTAQGSACPNENCPIANPSRQELPISEGLIQDWRNIAALGGTCAPPTCSSSGDFSLSNGSTVSLGPLYVPGSFALSNGSELIVTGTIWVAGPITFDNNAIVRLDSEYGRYSGVILGDDVAQITNNVEFYGSGDPASFPMVLSAKNDPFGTVINVDNNAQGVIYYANNGFIEFANGATAREATAYGIIMNNNAVIVYDAGLADARFSSGPSAGWQALSWREVE